MILSIVAIGFGAALGALLRWYFATRLNALFPQLPPGTLAANILGGYLIGIAMAVFLAYPSLAPEWRLLTVTGFFRRTNHLLDLFGGSRDSAHRRAQPLGCLNNRGTRHRQRGDDVARWSVPFA